MTDQTMSIVKSDARTLGECYILRQRNATQSFCQLPPEIRGYILQILAAIDPHNTPKCPDRGFVCLDDHLEYLKYIKKEPPTLGWIQATHVCSAWRDAAIACKYIWKDVPSMLSSCCAQAFAQRAGTMSVRYVRTKPLDAPEVNNIITHLHHIAELDLDLTANFTLWRAAKDDDLDGASRAVLEPERPLPHLVHLAPVLRRLALRSERLISDHGSAMLAGLFAGGAPDLRDVVLHILPVPWGPVARTFHNLVSLDIALPLFLIADWRTEEQHVPTRTQVLAILAACASTLEVVKIDLNRCSFEESTEPSPSASTVDSEERILLPRITVFSLHMHAANFSEIFERIEVPPSAAISGTLFGDHIASFRDARPLVDALKRHAAWRLTAGAPFVRLDVEDEVHFGHTVCDVVLSLLPEFKSTPHSIPPCTFRIVFRTHSTEVYTLEERWLAMFFHTIPLGTITDLRIDATYRFSSKWDPDTWFCDGMPRVRRLQMSTIDSGFGFPQRYLRDYEVETMGCLLLGDWISPTPTAVPFPHLETLAIDTAKICFWDDAGWYDAGIKCQAEMLAQLVQKRRSAGGPLKKVVLVEAKQYAGMGARDAVLVAALKEIGLEDLQVTISVQ
ncbi:hypothetical protein EVG20_g6521 [Dentipellis fragilis]|uniref:F-box domain-containing protein n=1 Tax=Dentipellis fragilis TaxID=205917 RepID=A0A4Y9YK79_9AGAM|nr:hypothetical protein EVG20_g6521 [Dentipellis fragilis]